MCVTFAPVLASKLAATPPPAPDPTTTTSHSASRCPSPELPLAPCKAIKVCSLPWRCLWSYLTMGCKKVQNFWGPSATRLITQGRVRLTWPEMCAQRARNCRRSAACLQSFRSIVDAQSICSDSSFSLLGFSGRLGSGPRPDIRHPLITVLPVCVLCHIEQGCASKLAARFII